MAEQTITIQGVKLTKKDLQKALADIDTVLKPGDIVRETGEYTCTSEEQLVVVSGGVRDAMLLGAWATADRDDVAVVGIHTGYGYFKPRRSLMLVGA